MVILSQKSGKVYKVPVVEGLPSINRAWTLHRTCLQRLGLGKEKERIFGRMGSFSFLRTTERMINYGIR